MGRADFFQPKLRLPYFSYFPAALLGSKRKVANNWMVNRGCGFKLFPHELNSKSDSPQEDPSAMKYDSPNQYTPALAARMGALGEVVVIRSRFQSLSPPVPTKLKNKKNKNRRGNLPRILLLLGYWMAEQKEDFNLAFREIKCHCFTKKISRFHC